MELYKIENGTFKLDGGAMFGVVPKVLWKQKYQADENNMITLNMRSLLIKDHERVILIDNGIGNKISDKMRKMYEINHNTNFNELLEPYSLAVEDITDVVLTHLHFDHCGGSTLYNNQGELQVTFPNATYWLSKYQWETAINPNDREKPSLLPENYMPINEAEQLKLIEDTKKLTDNIILRLFHGHTTGQIVPVIQSKYGTIVYTGDLFPLAGNIPVRWITAYDINPIACIEEKKTFLQEAYENNYIFFFEHDALTECCTLTETEKGIRQNHTFSLQELKDNW